MRGRLTAVVLDAHVLHQGFLWKWSIRKRLFKRRYFLVRDNDTSLLWFLASQVAPPRPGQTVYPPESHSLYGVTVEWRGRWSEGHDHCFEIASMARPQERLLLSAASEDEARSWMHVIEATSRRPHRDCEDMQVWNSVPGVRYPILRAEMATTTMEERFLLENERDAFFELRDVLNAEECSIAFHITVLEVKQAPALPPGDPYGGYYVCVRLVYGSETLMEAQTDFSRTAPKWNRWFPVTGAVAHLPLESWIVVSFFAVSSFQHRFPNIYKVVEAPYHVHIPLSNGFGQIRSGGQVLQLPMWPGGAYNGSDGPCRDPHAPVVLIEFESTPLPLVYPRGLPSRWLLQRDACLTEPVQMVPSAGRDEIFENPALRTPEMRRSVRLSRSLPGALSVVPPSQVALHVLGFDFTKEQSDIYAFVESSQFVGSRVTGIQLLDQCASQRIRYPAMSMMMQSLSDPGVNRKNGSFLILCALIAEQHDYAPTMDVVVQLVRRDPSLMWPLFWVLEGEAHPEQPFGRRFSILLRALFQVVPVEEAVQFEADRTLVRVISQASRDETRRQALPQCFKGLSVLERRCRLPTSQDHWVTGVDSVDVFPSARAPLRIGFRVEELGKVPCLIAKSGDDLYSDLVVNMMSSEMNALFEASGLDLRVKNYCIVVTGPHEGLIEVIPACTELAEVQKNGFMYINGDFGPDSLRNWFASHKDPNLSWESLMHRFVTQVAGACVLEYVLGVGDRHGGNIMIQRDGSYFHIDFSYFLGHDWKEHVTSFTIPTGVLGMLGGIEGADWKRMCDFAVAGFLCLRKHHALLFSMLHLALPAFLRREPHRAMYVPHALMPHKPEKEMEAFFRAQLWEAAKKHSVIDLRHSLHNVAIRLFA